MSTFIYIMIFIMGTFFGSFFTLAVYRIPLKKNITHEHSFCPTCDHKLGVWDLIPVFSYLFLRGKCRYCGEKVRIRYFILEILSGVVFFLAFLSLNIHNIFFDIDKLIYFISFVFMYVTLVIVAGIDKEYRKINKSVLLFGTICQAIYMLYPYMVANSNVYRYIIYFVLFMILFLILSFVKKCKDVYLVELVLLIAYTLFVLDFKAILPIMLITIILIPIFQIIGREKYKKISQIPMGFLISFSAIFYKIVENFIDFYIV